MTTDRSRRKVDANSRIVLTGGAVGLGLGLIGAMAWADGSSAAVDAARPDAIPAAVDTTFRRIIVIVPDSAGSRAELPAGAVASPRRSVQAPVSRSQGS